MCVTYSFLATYIWSDWCLFSRSYSAILWLYVGDCVQAYIHTCVTCEYIYIITLYIYFYTRQISSSAECSHFDLSPPVPMSVKVTHTYCTDWSCSCYDANFDICLCSVVADPLNKPPELLEFLSQVASKARDKWEMIGLVLNIMPDQLNVISKKHHNPMLCYSEVFTTWKNKEKPVHLDDHRWSSQIGQR